MGYLYKVIFIAAVAVCLTLGSVSNIRAQQVAISEYLHSTTKSQEWVELIVLDDNVSIGNWTLRDNNDNLNSWSSPFTFSANPLWNNLRRGTIIILKLTPGGADPLGLAKNEGYLEMTLPRAAGAPAAQYFTAPVGSPSMEINAEGDVLHLRNAAGGHIHALAHRNLQATAGFFALLADYANGTQVPRLINITFPSPLADNASVRAFPAANQAGYTASGIFGLLIGGTSSGTNNVTRGFPNSAPGETANIAYWRALRQPDWASGRNMTFSFPNANSLLLQWGLAFLDPVPTDSVSGYMVVRSNTPNFFTTADSLDALDGRMFNPGDALGVSQVVATVRGSQRTQIELTGDLPPCGDTVYYRVYAWRYDGNSAGTSLPDLARGRAYNELEFAQTAVVRPGPTDVNLLVNGNPISADTIPVCGGPYSLEVTATGNFSVVIFRDGTPVSASATASLVLPGTYYADVTDDNGGCVIRTDSIVVVDITPEVVFDIDSPVIQCLQGNNFTLRATGTPSGGTYRWTSGGLVTAPPQPEVDISFTSPGIYTIEVEYILDFGGQECSAVQTREIEVLPSPEIFFAQREIRICAGREAALSATVVGADGFGWVGFPAGVSTVNVFPTETAYYVMEAANSDCTVRDSVLVTVVPLPEAEIISESGNFVLCDGGSIELRANIISGDIFEWQPSGSRDTVLRVTSPGMYTLQVSTLEGCRELFTVDVTTSPTPDAFVIGPGERFLCAGESITLVANDPGESGVSYRWNTGELATTLVVNTAGEYYRIAENNDGCIGTSASIVVRNAPTAFVLGAPPLVDLGEVTGCDAERETTVTITNPNDAPLRVRITANAPFFASPSVITVPPDARGEVLIRYAPSESGDDSDILTFTTEPCNVRQEIRISGRSNREAAISTTETDINFGTVNICPNAETIREFSVRLADGKNVRFDAIEVEPPFRIINPPTFPVAELNAPLRIAFTPSEEGTFTGDVRIVYQDLACPDPEVLVIPLSVIARNASIAVAGGSDTVRFAPLVCAASTTYQLPISNPSEIDIDIQVRLLESSNDVSLISSPALARAGETQQARLQFSPSSEGEQAARLIVVNQLCNDTTEVVLIFTSSNPVLAADFEEELFVLLGCETRTTSEIILSNPTDEVIRISRVESGGLFPIEGIQTGQVVRPGETLAFNVSFFPTGAGRFLNTIVIETEPCSQRLQLRIEGIVSRAAARVVGGVVQFGEVPPSGTATIEVPILNNGTEDLRIAAMTDIGEPFSWERFFYQGGEVALPFVLPPDETLIAELRFSPTEIGDFNGISFVRVDEPCSIFPDSVRVAARSTTTAPGAGFTIDMRFGEEPFAATPGNTADIDLFLTVEHPALSLVEEIVFWVDYNPNLLEAREVAQNNLAGGATASFAEESPGRGVLRLQQLALPLEEGAVPHLRLRFRSLLYPDRQTRVAIMADTSLLRSSTGYLTQQAGSDTATFTQLDTCASDNRFVVSTTGLRLRIRGEGIQSVAELISDTDDPLNVIFYNVIGQEVYSLEPPLRQRGTYHLPIGNYLRSDGAYFAVVKREHETFVLSFIFTQ